MKLVRSFLLSAALVLTLAPPASAQTTVNVAMQDSVFSPASVTIRRGTIIRWTNRGRLVHTTTSNQGLWDRTLRPGESVNRRFSSPGTFAYRCTIHRAMTGSIRVT